jgi:hypothetical protein
MEKQKVEQAKTNWIQHTRGRVIVRNITVPRNCHGHVSGDGKRLPEVSQIANASMPRVSV